MKLEISYEDEAGNVTTAEKTITLFVNEAMMDDMMMGDDFMMEDGMMPEGGEGTKPKTGLIVGIAAVVIAAAVAGFVVFLKLRKKKKAALEEAADLADLEKDIFK